MLEHGSFVELAYPTNTHVELIDHAPEKPRNLMVHSMRDLVKTPLTPIEFLRRPYTARSRWLLRAWDVDHRVFRQFYLGSTRKFRSPGCLRIVLEDPDRDPPRVLLGREYQATVTDRRAMVKKLIRWLHEQPDLESQLKIIAPDMRIVA